MQMPFVRDRAVVNSEGEHDLREFPVRHRVLNDGFEEILVSGGQFEVINLEMLKKLVLKKTNLDL